MNDFGYEAFKPFIVILLVYQMLKKTLSISTLMRDTFDFSLKNHY